MKSLSYILAAMLAGAASTLGRGTFVYDQESTNLVEGSADLKLAQPLGQSFTPALVSVGFVEFNFYDGDVLHSSGATVVVNLRSNAITGPILGISASVFMPNGFFGVTNFVFTTSIPVTPGVVYYLQPMVQSGDDMGAYLTDASYTGGSAISQGVPVPDRNLWYREGVVVPEPSAALVILIGGGLLLWRRFPNP